MQSVERGLKGKVLRKQDEKRMFNLIQKTSYSSTRERFFNRTPECKYGKNADDGIAPNLCPCPVGGPHVPDLDPASFTDILSNLHIPRKSIIPVWLGRELKLREMGRLPKGTAGQKQKWKAGQTGSRARDPAIRNHL